MRFKLKIKLNFIFLFLFILLYIKKKMDQHITNYNKEYRYQIYASETEKQRLLFSPWSIKLMQNQIAFFLKGVHPENLNIIVPEKTIVQVADSFYENTVAHLEVLQAMIVKFIVNAIREEYETINQNNKLSIWVTKYDTDSGLKRFNDIKLNNKRRRPYNMFTY
jgi:hypothetical protein